MNGRDRCRAVAFVVAAALWLPPLAAASDLFPAAEVREAQGLRQQLLDAVPGLDLARLRRGETLSAADLGALTERLQAVEGREGANPFFHWVRGELLRRTEGVPAAGDAYARAAEAAADRPLVHWILWREHLFRDLAPEAERHEDWLAPWQVRLGLIRAPLLAESLAAAAQAAHDGGDPAEAVGLYTRALRHDPDHAAALAGRAGAAWAHSPARIAGVIGDVLKSLAAAAADPIAFGRLGSNLLLSLSMSWLACLAVAAGFAVLRHHDLLRHDLQDGPLRRFPAGTQRALVLLVLLWPLMLGLGLLWTAAWTLVVLAPYLTRPMRVTVSVLLAGMLVMPMGYHWMADQHRLAASPRLATSLAAEQGGRGEDLVATLADWRTRNPTSGLAAYYLGLVERRRGNLAAAETAMAAAVELRPRWSFAHTGLGNIQALREQFSEAEKSYQRALAIRGSFAAASNLATLYAAGLQLEKSSELLATARRLDPHGASALALLGARAGVSVVLDEPVPSGLLAAGLAAGGRGTGWPRVSGAGHGAAFPWPGFPGSPSCSWRPSGGMPAGAATARPGAARSAGPRSAPPAIPISGSAPTARPAPRSSGTVKGCRQWSSSPASARRTPGRDGSGFERPGWAV